MIHSKARHLAAFIGLALAVVTMARPCMADGGRNDLAWNAAWPTFRPAEYVVTATAGMASLLAYFALPTRDQPRWSGGILFDDAARNALRAQSPAARDRVRTLSDVTALSTLVWAVGVDSLLVPLARGSGSVAWQLTLIDAESFALSTLVTTTMFKTIARARPSYEDCLRDPSFDPLCNSGATASFPSGHTNIVFTAAGLSCAHHMNVALYGGGVADGIACGGTVVLASATAALRVIGDRHYMSDVLVGGAIGFGTGFALPMLLHYAVPGHDAAVTIAPMQGVAPAGLVIAGVF
jgi:membrane-associated phospholipid phosphatase